MGINLNSKNITLTIGVYVFSYAIIILIINLFSQISLYLGILIWLISLCLPEFFATFFHYKKTKRIMNQTEQVRISFLSAIIKTVYFNKDEIILFLNTSYKDQIAFVISFIAFFMGAVFIVWIVEYFMYFLSSRLLQKFLIFSIK